MSNFWIKKYKEDKDAKLKEILKQSNRPISPECSDNPNDYINYWVKEKVPVKYVYEKIIIDGRQIDIKIVNQKEKDFDVVDLDLYCKEIMERNRELLRFCIEEKEIVFMCNKCHRPDNSVQSIYRCENKKVVNNGV